MREEASELMNLETDMRKALGGEEFALHYQPIVSLPALRPVSLEALARWPGHDNGAHPVSPLEFIPVAEESGLILELGDWALREACRQMSVWRTEMEWVRSMSVAVNLSARQFAQPQLALRIREGLVDCSMPAATLRLEVNEDTLMDRAERAVSILEDLRQSGVGICIDDFGTGCSSLSHLYRLPLDQVKIDIGFVRDVHTSSETREIVRAMVNLAHNLGLTTVAEGVEEKAQLDALVELGCDFAQGFYFAEPMTASETREYLGRLGRK
jgi:EAL domain-containing protein (putative c-di-GMP-specific phosphodiesterase class I)